MKKSTLKNDHNEECPLCLEIKPNYQFMALSKCNHKFCKQCLKRIVSFNVSSVARCPYRDCDQLLEEAEQQNILYSSKVTSSIQRSTPITKQLRSLFKKKEKVSHETIQDIDSSCEDNVLGAAMPRNSLDNHKKLSFSKSEEAILAITKTNDFSRFPETINSREQLCNNNEPYRNDRVPNYLKNEESLDNFKRRTSKDETNYTKRQFEENISNNVVVQLSESDSKATTDLKPTEYGDFCNEHVVQTAESHILINLEIPNVLSSNPEHHKEHSYNRAKTKRHNQWNAQSRFQLQQYIRERYQKDVDFMFVAIKADILLNTCVVECLMCREQLSIHEGITFPYCSYSFCRICLINSDRAYQTKCTDECVLLYSNSSIQNKNCAIILDGEIKDLLMESNRFLKLQKEFVLGKTTLKSDIDDSLKPNQYIKTFQGTNDGNSPLISFETTSKEVLCEGSNLLKTWSDVVLLRNSSSTACLMCYKSICAMKGVILRDCFHVFCDRCLIDTIMKTLDSCVEVRCPMILDDKRWCRTIIQEREIKCLLAPEQYEKYERKCLEAAQQGFESSARCFKPSCTGWIVFEGYKDSFICPVCGNQNCLSCKAIHHGKSCSGYMMQQEKKFKQQFKIGKMLSQLQKKDEFSSSQ